jgi:ABC-type phosphonate transport system ATPase subunit
MTSFPPQGHGAGLSARGVSKRFGSTQALSGVDFDIAPGEIVGLIGAMARASRPSSMSSSALSWLTRARFASTAAPMRRIRPATRSLPES